MHILLLFNIIRKPTTPPFGHPSSQEEGNGDTTDYHKVSSFLIRFVLKRKIPFAKISVRLFESAMVTLQRDNRHVIRK